ncbi:MAG: methenyltetrahydromethanopterin cyclohydrolase [Pirellulales bacterium]|nr:methenyltetrahydromethanopterin cyclohydrolase [Pirellulales bacterium]
METPSLNGTAAELCRGIVDQADRFRVLCNPSRHDSGGARMIDCGIDAPGGLEAGRRLAEVCLAGLGHVRFVPSDPSVWHGLAVQVRTDFPVAACLASQYAGWEIKTAEYFAMGSGPMRAAAGREALFNTIGFRESAAECVGVLESGHFPPDSVCRALADACGIPVNRLILLIAPTRSIACTVQVVARSIETAMHKLHELEFDLTRIVSGYGIAPLPPPALDDMTAIGRTNDAILYGGEVTLYARGDDQSLQEILPKIPSSASSDHGRPFGHVFADYGYDFYKVDPLLFSPAVVTLINLDTGNMFRAGQTRSDVLGQSFR